MNKLPKMAATVTLSSVSLAAANAEDGPIKIGFAIPAQSNCGVLLIAHNMKVIMGGGATMCMCWMAGAA